MDEISAVDRDALQRSLIACRAESRARSRQIDAKLRHEPWERVAQFASYSAQIESLGLSPYQDPPVYARLRNLAKPYDDPRGERESAEILKKLLALGLSRYEPHPLRAMTCG